MKKLLTTTLSIALSLLLALPATAQDAPAPTRMRKRILRKKTLKRKKGKHSATSSPTKPNQMKDFLRYTR
jgi:hypothetical protein